MYNVCQLRGKLNEEMAKVGILVFRHRDLRLRTLKFAAGQPRLVGRGWIIFYSGIKPIQGYHYPLTILD